MLLSEILNALGLALDIIGFLILFRLAFPRSHEKRVRRLGQGWP